MDVCGEGRNITRVKMLELAEQGGLEASWATEIMQRFVEQSRQFKQLAIDRNVRKATIKFIEAAIDENRKRLA